MTTIARQSLTCRHCQGFVAYDILDEEWRCRNCARTASTSNAVEIENKRQQEIQMRESQAEETRMAQEQMTVETQDNRTEELQTQVKDPPESGEAGLPEYTEEPSGWAAFQPEPQAGTETADQEEAALAPVPQKTFMREPKDPEEWFAKLRWPGGPRCPKCDSANHSAIGATAIATSYRCRDCKTAYSLRTGTLLAASRGSYQQWLDALETHFTNPGLTEDEWAAKLGFSRNIANSIHARISQAVSTENDDLVNPITYLVQNGMDWNNLEYRPEPEPEQPQGPRTRATHDDSQKAGPTATKVQPQAQPQQTQAYQRKTDHGQTSTVQESKPSTGAETAIKVLDQVRDQLTQRAEALEAEQKDVAERLVAVGAAVNEIREYYGMTQQEDETES